MNFPPIFLFFFELTKLHGKIASASTHKKPVGNELTGAPFHRNTLFPPPLLPPPSSNNPIHLTRELVFFSTLRHNAHGGRCRSVGKIGINLAPAEFVGDKKHKGAKLVRLFFVSLTTAAPLLGTTPPLRRIPPLPHPKRRMPRRGSERLF
jgi:hypothetical protein